MGWPLQRHTPHPGENRNVLFWPSSAKLLDAADGDGLQIRAQIFWPHPKGSTQADGAGGVGHCERVAFADLQQSLDVGDRQELRELEGYDCSGVQCHNLPRPSRRG
jgi:hypothetical protein